LKFPVFPVISDDLFWNPKMSQADHRIAVVLAKQQEIHHSPLSRWPRGEALVKEVP
jgi:hypothetical protein